MRVRCRDCGSLFLTTGHCLAEIRYCNACRPKHPSKMTEALASKPKARKRKKAK